MPFVFALLNGEADLSECLQLTEKETTEMSTFIKKSDWRENLIVSLKEKMRNVQFAAVSNNLGAELKEGQLLLRCFGRDVFIGSDGGIRTHKHLTQWMRILLLLYINNGGSEGLAGKWVLHSELRGGLMKVKAFKRECEEPMRELLDRHFRKVSVLLDEYGAEHQEEFSTPNAWLVYVFPRLPVLILYWPEEDEFESKVTIRFDSSADRYFDVEQLIFLVEELAKDLGASL